MATVKYLQNPKAQQCLGIIILCIAILSLLIGYNNNIINIKTNDYQLKASFKSIEGLQVGSPVTLSGIKVGKIEAITLQQNETDYKVMLSLALNNSIRLSQDASANITSNNIFGKKHLRLTQGGSFLELQNNDEILYTASSVDFLQLLETLIHRAENK